MNLFDRIAATFGYTKTQAITQPPAWLVAEATGEQFNIPDRYLPEAQLELYQRLSWVQIAVYQVAAMAATSAFGVMQLQGEKKRKVENHPFELLLQRPNPLMSRYELFFGTFADYDLTGVGYWWLNRANETVAPSEIWRLPCHKVKPVPDGRMFLKGYTFESDDGQLVPLGLHEVVEFKRYNPLHPFAPLSPIESLAITAMADMNMQKYGANFFDKGFAKPQGALAFSDPIPDDQWKTLKADVEREHGGTKRKLMILRGVGAGGVQWVQMALSQKDMEFLESRTFNKEEIFAMYAPGLASMLAVNATEANSIAGKKTFTEMAVWPHLVSIQEKITNDLLPAYGQNLVGEFEDIRITDRAMQLSEQSAYAAVHTIDEVRERFYEAQPIGDDRGKLLLAEVGKGLTNTNEPPSPEQQMEMERQRAELNRPAPAEGEDKPQTEGQPESDEPDEEVRETEAKRFKKWLKKRPNVDVTKFDSDILSDAELVAIAAQIKHGEGGADQGFFTGKATRKLPGADGNDAERAELEDYHAGKLYTVFRKVLRAVAPPGTTVENITPDLAVARYQQNQKLIRDAIIELLMDGAQLGADTGIAQAETILGVRKAVSIEGINWDLVNEDVLQWVLGSTGGGFGTGYGNGLAASIAQTSENQIRANVAEWINNGLPFNVLLDNLERSTFSRQRADMIATTEITRAYAEGNRTAWRRSNVIQRMIWQTAADERVCPICAPLQGKETEVAGDFNGVFPPAHPRCRCWVNPLAVLPEPAPIASGGFPPTIDNLEQVRSLGGSTGANLVRDPATGKLYVMKRGANAEHLREEVAADQAYKALGVPVPDVRLYETPQGPVKLAQYIEGRTLKDLRNDRRAFTAATKELKKNFAADALLGNRDVIGQDFDNIIVDADGVPWRIDNGGSFRFRAQGQRKDTFDQYPLDLWTMRNAKINAQTASVYGDLSYKDLTKQMRALKKQQGILLDALPADLQPIMKQRLATLEELAKTGKTMMDDEWADGYVDNFSRHWMQMRAAGITNRYPTKLTNRGVDIYDPSGKHFDDLRGPNSVIGEFANYLDSNGGKYSTVTHWMERQASDSWSGASQGTKYFYASQRGNMDNYYWHRGLDTSKGHYDSALQAVGEEQYRESFTAWHAFNYDFLRSVDFAKNNRKKGVVELMRTENDVVMQAYGLKPGETGQIKRGAAESTSIYSPVRVYGTEMTIQQVPHHRVFGSYFFERTPRSSTSPFMGDHENEFVVMTDGLDVFYEKR